LTFARANLAHGRRGIAKTKLAEGVREQIVMKIPILTGKVSRAFIVRRNVLGCLSRDGGARGELRCVMAREKRRELEGGRGKGGREREKGREGRGRRPRGEKRGHGGF
jgi:hypothetical protein